MCGLLRMQSCQIWNDLEDARRLGTPYHEDTITQNLALCLARDSGSGVRMLVCSRKAENKIGSDFIWVFADHSRQRAIKLLVQAKRLYNDGWYSAYSPKQLVKIQSLAKRVGGTPLYLTYNHSPMGTKYSQSKCPRCRKHNLMSPTDLGLFAVHANQLQSAKSRNSFTKQVIASGVPFWWLFCCGQSTKGGGTFSALCRNLNELTNRLYDEAKDQTLLSEVSASNPTNQVLRDWLSEKSVDYPTLINALTTDSDGGKHKLTPSFVLGTVFASE